MSVFKRISKDIRWISDYNSWLLNILTLSKRQDNTSCTTVGSTISPERTTYTYSGIMWSDTILAYSIWKLGLLYRQLHILRRSFTRCTGECVLSSLCLIVMFYWMKTSTLWIFEISSQVGLLWVVVWSFCQSSIA